LISGDVQPFEECRSNGG
jgi:hypothetical protein